MTVKSYEVTITQMSKLHAIELLFEFKLVRNIIYE